MLDIGAGRRQRRQIEHHVQHNRFLKVWDATVYCTVYYSCLKNNIIYTSQSRPIKISPIAYLGGRFVRLQHVAEDAVGPVVTIAADRTRCRGRRHRLCEEIKQKTRRGRNGDERHIKVHCPDIHLLYCTVIKSSK